MIRVEDIPQSEKNRMMRCARDNALNKVIYINRETGIVSHTTEYVEEAPTGHFVLVLSYNRFYSYAMLDDDIRRAMAADERAMDRDTDPAVEPIVPDVGAMTTFREDVNYFLPLGADDKHALTENGIVWYPFELSGSEGGLVDGGSCVRALEVLELSASEEVISGLEGILRLVTHPRIAAPVAPVTESESPKHQVIIGRWDGCGVNHVKKAIREVLLPHLDQDVVLDVPHGSAHPVESDGRFHIFVWSGPQRKRLGMRSPTTMFGIKVHCQDDPFLSSGEGIDFMDGDYAVAELVNYTNLYIHHDLFHHGHSDEIALFREILIRVVAELARDPEERARLQAECRKKLLVQSSKIYATKCMSGINRRIERIEVDVRDCASHIESLQDDLVNNIRRQQDLVAVLDALKRRPNDKAKYESEFDNIAKIDKVIDVIAREDCLQVMTDTLYCLDPRTNRLHEIGKFKIEIYWDGSHSGVRWYNLTNPPAAYLSMMNAPHVFQDGRACLGNIQEVIPDLIGQYEYAALVVLAIRFIESVNVADSAGKHINRWPLAPDEMQPEGAVGEVLVEEDDDVAEDDDDDDDEWEE